MNNTDNREFFTIVYNIDDVETVEEYEEFDDARSDFKYFTEMHDVEYAVLQHVCIEDGIETIDIVFEYRKGE